MKTLRIFISSPSDVQEERDKAKQVITALQREVGDDVRLLAVLWEDLAIPATASFQEGIDFVLSERHRIDIAVFILWSRLGSPLGNAITKPDGSAYRSGTEREFDLMLAAFDHSGRKMPLILAYTRDDLGAFSEKLDARTQHDDALEELLRQRKLVKQFIHERFHDAEGRSLRAYHSYPEPVAFAQRLHVHLRQAVNDLIGLDHPAALWTDSPYRSLEVFDIQHAPIFCGRDEETCDVLQRLRDQQAAGCAFVCIVGASGSGKSSLARAGVAATLLQRSFDDGIKEWRTAIFIPGHAQGDLFNALARVLASALPELRDGIGGLEKLAQCFESQNHEAASILIDTAFRATSVRSEGVSPSASLGSSKSGRDALTTPQFRLLILLDQLEELWTDRSITPEQREKFLQTIESLARSGSISVLATLRSDFYPQAQLSPAFLRMKAERGHFDLTPPGPAALQQLIVQPARRAGLHFERHPQTSRSLDQQILEDASRDPSALPLLQYALAELYEKWSAQSPERRSARTLLLSDYDEMGGVEGALTKRAAQTFDSLPAEVRAALDELLPLLISVDTAGEQNAVRRRAPLADLTSTPARRSLTEALVKARFLTTDDQSGAATVTLAHEALLGRWKTVSDWVLSNRNNLLLRARVEQTWQRWRETDKDSSMLLPEGLALEEGRKLLLEAPALLNSGVITYIEASEHACKTRRARVRRIRQVVAASLALLALVSSISAVWAMLKQQEAQRQRDAAQKSGTEAQAARNVAEGLINSMLFDLRDKLKPLGRLDLLDDVSRQAQSYFEQQEPSRLGAEALRNMGSMFYDRGSVLRKGGHLEEAREAIRKGMDIHSRLAQANPRDHRAQGDLAVGYGQLSSVALADGDFVAARDARQKVMDIRQRLAKAEPRNFQAQRDFAGSLWHIGHQAEMEGDLKVARETFAKAFEIRERLALGYPDDVQAQGDLAESYGTLGSLAATERDFKPAREAYQKALEIHKRLAQADPSNIPIQGNLASNYDDLGSLDHREGNLSAARETYQKALDIHQRLAQIDATNLETKGHLATSYQNVGSVAAAESNFIEARTAYQKAWEISQHLAEADPTSAVNKFNSAFIGSRLGGVELMTGNRDDALTHTLKAKEIASQFLGSSIEAVLYPKAAYIVGYTCMIEAQCRSALNPTTNFTELRPIIEEGRTPLLKLKQAGRLTGELVGLLTELDKALARLGNNP